MRTLRVANCSGFFGDRLSAAKEMVTGGDIDVLTGDWLAELTMIILRRQMAKNPETGYAGTFVKQLEDVLGTCLEKGIKIVSNAGGLNPGGAARAVEKLAGQLGLPVRVGVVTGDDILARVPELIERGALTQLDTGEPIDLDGRTPLAANAYLGGWGITECLNRGADVVVTGRVTDAAVVVGPAAWAFDWGREDFDKLAGAVVAGHVIECGGQATGGNFSFYDEVSGIERVGFPLAEIREDGSSVITKHRGTGGTVSIDTVKAQLLYEVGGPQYANPDVTALLDSISLSSDGDDRVEISGVRGQAPPPGLKVSMAVEGGYRNQMLLCLTGDDPEGKADVALRTIWEMIPGGREAFDRVDVELIGRPVSDPESFGAATTLLRVAVAGSDQKLVGRAFSGAVVQTGLSSYPGFYATSPPGSGTAYETYIPAVVPADEVTMTAEVDGETIEVPNTGSSVSAPLDAPSYADAPGAELPCEAMRKVPLGELAGARSGDKGGHANLGLWARSQENFDYLDGVLTVAKLRELIPGTRELKIQRHRLPNLWAINFVIEGFLGDGVSSSLRLDAQAKGLAEFARARHIDVPMSLMR
ncbi:acyclic terpene utilization AtuA family protein [Epidermidibacterium keratini]|uniref:Acyclic terpene utilization AtuA family protein n=1 Tax=Epidermidibacterium keratini TaxID=1891644 RepID=A0A7L4YME2_9ACTN|nr:acyclic terpene utilization AtuA family protein [Epidermidibacterium keratini]QHC00326.1 acyclic terpene utilization AtuA family protein [Epidermidibacterium keratini]